jgi:hypothetical protein
VCKGQKQHTILHGTPDHEPHTRGEMRKKLRKICEEVGEESGIRVNTVERGRSKICKSKSLVSKKCGRDKCLICKSGEKSKVL